MLQPTRGLILNISLMGNPLFLWPTWPVGESGRQGALRVACFLELLVQICHEAILLDGIHHTDLPHRKTIQKWWFYGFFMGKSWKNRVATWGGVSEHAGVHQKCVNMTISHTHTHIYIYIYTMGFSGWAYPTCK